MNPYQGQQSPMGQPMGQQPIGGIVQQPQGYLPAPLPNPQQPYIGIGKPQQGIAPYNQTMIGEQPTQFPQNQQNNGINQVQKMPSQPNIQGINNPQASYGSNPSEKSDEQIEYDLEQFLKKSQDEETPEEIEKKAVIKTIVLGLIAITVIAIVAGVIWFSSKKN
jgi:hypothetical protein